ncbi:DUF305 domain-containing protein [Knoellia sp. LjRoot47]|uniref:DUF305 domain-containing protein n=1 Tax=Knoellia sp. LjRoot47 TaxID=3342330 RepID=UPI003ECCFB9B
MPIRRSTSAVALAGLLALGLSGCSGEPKAQPVPRTPGATSSDPVIQPGRPGEPNATLSGGVATVAPRTVSKDDVTFYQDMIVHHSQALVMVETALPRMTDTQVKSLASRIGDEQKPEILTMTTWLQERKQEVPPQATNPRLGDHDHMGMPGMATPAQMAELAQATGVAADRLFLTLMINHHKGALTMVGEHGKNSGEEVVEEMAADINVTQAKQISQMQGMLARLS